MNFDLNNWSLIASIASFILALIIAVVPPLRAKFKSLVRLIAWYAGTDRKRYSSWFEDHYGQLRNVYRERAEQLSLRDTYVPLAAYQGNETQRLSATEVLRRSESNRIIILGDPGSGKSTILRAFGMSVIRLGQSATSSAVNNPGRRKRYTPVFIALRAFARYLELTPPSDRSLKIFIDQEVLSEAAGVRQSAVLLEKLLRGEALLLLLDGLDEVPDSLRLQVRREILSFIHGRDIRVVLTCRRQNFRQLRDEWIPAFTEEKYVYLLAPLRDAEIRAFIARRARDFHDTRTPSDLFQSIVQSGTLELHRVPLILTISIGLYLQLIGYRIPTSLAAFYGEMIKQLLTRHDFTLEATGSVNLFAADDKLRFLREFSYQAAERPGRFEDFALDELVTAADVLAVRLPSVDRRRTEEFVNEIVNRAGLLVQSSVQDSYVFAHRSIQEFLIADYLKGDPQTGCSFLLSKSSDPEWRLVTVFFASFDHAYVEQLVRGLLSRQPDLCGQCLAVASVADEDLARSVIRSLKNAVLDETRNQYEISMAFSALVAVSNSALPWIRSQTVSALLECLEGGSGLEFSELLELDQDSTAKVIQGLANVRNARTVPQVARLATLPTADNIRNISPLWGSFWIGFAQVDLTVAKDDLRRIADRLLQLSTSEDGLRELQGQQQPEPHVEDLAYLTTVVYPFEHGVPRTSNLPLILAACRRLGIQVGPVNTLVKAIEENDPDLLHLERDARRKADHVELHRPYRLVVLVFAVLSILVYAWNFRRDNGLLYAHGQEIVYSIYPILSGISVPLATLALSITLATVRTLSRRRREVHLVRTLDAQDDRLEAVGHWWQLEMETSTNDRDSSLLSRQSLNSIDVRHFLAATTIDRKIGVAEREVILDYLRQQRYLSDNNDDADNETRPFTRVLDRAFNVFRPQRSGLSFQQLWCISVRVVVITSILASAERMNLALWLELPLVAALGMAVFWLPDRGPFSRGHRLYFRKPNPLLSIYRNPNSRHWVMAPRAGSS